jgi:hypothetical protein
MYTGHFAVALAAAGAARRVPIGLLVVAAFGSDLLEAVYAAFGVNDWTRVWSHSLPATAAIGVVFALGWRAFGGRWSEGALLCAVAMTHTGLDLVTGVKAWWPGQPRAGLGWYGRPAADALIEWAMVGVAWNVWRSSIPNERRNSVAAFAMVALLVVAQGIAVAYFAFGGGGDPGALSKFLR